MIPKLEFDDEGIAKGWPNYSEEERNELKEHIRAIRLDDGTWVYNTWDTWIPMGVFKDYKKIVESHIEYGYCDTEAALIKLLEPYKASEQAYYVEIGVMNMDYEKYYKNGSYYNQNGEDTGEDYYDWIAEHPEDKVKQDFEGKWITFCISQIE